MKRRNFVKKTTAFTQGIMSLCNLSLVFKNKMEGEETIIGHGDYKYKTDMGWEPLNAQKIPVTNCLEIQRNSESVYPIKLNRI